MVLLSDGVIDLVPVDPVQVAGSAFGAGRLGAWTGGAVGGQGNLHGWPGC